jgi:hypothetical protein
MWIITAWQYIPPEMNVMGFRMFCITSAVDGTDDMLWNDSEGGNTDTDW